MLIALVIFCLLFAWLAWRRLTWAIFIIAAFLPGYLIRFQLLGIPLTLLESMILILFLIFLIKNKLSWLKNFRRQPFFWPIIAIACSATLAVIVSPNLLSALGIFKAYFIEPLLFFIVLISAVKTKNDWQKIFTALGLSAIYLSLFSFWQYFSAWGVPAAFLKDSGAVDRVVGPFGYPNALGLYLAPIIILFTGLLGQKNGRFQQAFKLIVIVFSFSAIVLAQSEAAILSVLAIWLLWGLLNKKTRKPFLLLIAIFVIVFLTNSEIRQYLLSKLLLQDYSGFIRRLIWQESWQMLKDHWFFGAGLAGYQTAIAPYHLPTFEIFLYPHNFALNFWSETGLLGLLSFAWLALKFLALNLKKLAGANRWLALTLIFILAQWLIHGLVDAPYFKNDLSMMFWLIMALAVADF